MADLAEAKELYTEAELAAVQAHIKRYFGDFQQSIKEYESPDICLEIAIIPPRPEHNYYTLATIGMGAHRMNVPEDEPELERAELLINLPPDWLLTDEVVHDEEHFWPVRLLRQMARLPIVDDAWFDCGHIVRNDGEPYAESTRLCSVLLLSPGVFGEPSYSCVLPGGEPVNFYQLIPLYQEELDFALENGLDRFLEQAPDELLEVIGPDRPNIILDAAEIGYDDALMEEAAEHLAIIQEKQLAVDELAAYNHLAIYLRWCLERGLMGNPFLVKHQEAALAVQIGQSPDLRLLLRDNADLQGRLRLDYFNQEGTAFARWYSWGSRATPYAYRKDVEAYAEKYFGLERIAGGEFKGSAYLFVPWSEQYYQDMAAVIDGRFAEWRALPENQAQKPVKPMAIKPEDIKMLLTDWDGPTTCFASDRIVVDGCKVGECYRLQPDLGNEGWDSGWNFFAGDEDEEYLDDSRHCDFYDLNLLCNYDPDILPLLKKPYGTWLGRDEDGAFRELEDE